MHNAILRNHLKYQYLGAEFLQVRSNHLKDKAVEISELSNIDIDFFYFPYMYQHGQVVTMLNFKVHQGHIFYKVDC